MSSVRCSAVLFALTVLAVAPSHAQMAGPMDAPVNAQPAPASGDAPAATDTSQAPKPNRAAQALITRAKSPHVNDTPLNATERAQQVLNRFTFGPRPGEVQTVTAMGAQKWFERQLHPQQIGDGTVDKRIANDYPALALQPVGLLSAYPSRRMVQAVAEGKQPWPTDPLELGLYEVLVYKWKAVYQPKDAASAAAAPPALTDDQIAQKKKDDQAAAARVAGELFALPKQDRMAALVKMPVEDRIAFVANVNGEQKTLLYADFTAREREVLSAMNSNANATGIPVPELQQAKMVRAILSERQLQEVMTDFWSNHFNIFINKDTDETYTASYERDVIRPHALGKFCDLLLATAESPAMMVYLDNWVSIGPNSIANGGNRADGKRGNKGLNENYAREVMELHTVGVNGGYTQADVTQLARILTGWTVDHPDTGGDFLFDPKRHEPGTKQWFGQTITEDGQNEGLHALETLAASPKTAHFISWLLAQRFVADEPPPALVDRMAKTYLSSDGDISAVLRTLVASPEFNSHRYYRNKVKTPMEFIASTYRSTATDPANAYALVDAMRLMGMPLYQALPPTGYYITADHWMNSAALIDRLNFAIQLTSGKVNGVKFDAPKLLTLEMMAQPAGKPQPGGPEMMLGVMESALLGGDVSATTSEFLRSQVNAPVQPGTPPPTPAETLNKLAALVMGSPEFQMR